MTPGVHGTTYGGNPLAMAAGNAVMNVMLEPGFLDHVNDMANQFKQGLASIVDRFPSVFSEVRGSGLLCGLKCVVANTDVFLALRERNILTVTAGDNALRLLPPLTVSADEIRIALNGIEAVARDVTESAGRKAG